MRCLLRERGIGGILRNLDGDGGLSQVQRESTIRRYLEGESDLCKEGRGEVYL